MTRAGNTVWSIGMVYNTNTFAIGSGQGTDSSFTSPVFNIAGGCVGIGYTSPSYALDVNGDIRSNGWLRSQGNAGWYSETYGGGWYMNDSTAVRAYNDKNIATGGWLYANTAYLSSGIIKSGQRSNFILGLQSDRNMCLSDNGAGIWCTNTYTSDMRLKKDIKPLENILPIIKGLSIFRFHFKEQVDDPKPQIGVSAQELIKVFPEYVYKPPQSKYYIVNYDKLSVLSLKAIQELSRENDQLKAESQKIKAENQEIKAALCELKPTFGFCADQGNDPGAGK